MAGSPSRDNQIFVYLCYRRQDVYCPFCIFMSRINENVNDRLLYLYETALTAREA
jgi:hypothetical protein